MGGEGGDLDLGLESARLNMDRDEREERALARGGNEGRRRGGQPRRELASRLPHRDIGNNSKHGRTVHPLALIGASKPSRGSLPTARSEQSNIFILFHVVFPRDPLG